MPRQDATPPEPQPESNNLSDAAKAGGLLPAQDAAIRDGREPVSTGDQAPKAAAAVAPTVPGDVATDGTPSDAVPVAADLVPDSNPETQPAGSVATADPAGDYVVPEWDPIGVVVPGALDAHLVVTLLGRGDSGHYGPLEVELVRQRQRDAGLEPTGVVSGLTWALLLPEISGPDNISTLGRAILRSLLKSRTRLDFPSAELRAVYAAGDGDATGDEPLPVVDRDAWAFLIALRVNEYLNPPNSDEPVAVEVAPA